MLDKEIAEIVHGHTRHLSVLQWTIGVGVSLVIGMVGTVAGMLFKFFRDFKVDAIRKIREHRLSVEKITDEIRREISMLDDCREENAGNIIRIQEDIKAVVKICQERHGK